MGATTVQSSLEDMRGSVKTSLGEVVVAALGGCTEIGALEVGNSVEICREVKNSEFLGGWSWKESWDLED